MDEGNYAEACPKFEASYRLDVAVGTLLNLGVCLELDGRLASAWAKFLEAAALAGRSGSTDREQMARQRAAALESRLIRVRINVTTHVPQMRVTLAERELDAVMWSVPIPVDPGTWAVRATAPGYLPWEGSVTATEEGSVVELAVPALEEAPVVEEPAQPDPLRTLREPVEPPPPPPNPLRTAGWVTTGLGLATLGAGVGLGLNAKSLWDGADCRDGFCPSAAAQQDAENARTRANIATGLYVAGGTIAAAGVVVLILSAGSDDEPDAEDSGRAQIQWSPVVGRQMTGLNVQGSF